MPSRPSDPSPASLTTMIPVAPGADTPFAAWQAQFHVAITAFPGFMSLEIISPSTSGKPEWMFTQNFHSSQYLYAWQRSEERRHLFELLTPYLQSQSPSTLEEITSINERRGNATEVFVTQIDPSQTRAYREWIAKIHAAEAQFPGFQGLHVQSPNENKSKNWITFLRFDTQEHLENWLQSPQRQAILQEASPFIQSLDTHRVTSSPYAGWFAHTSNNGYIPPVWKQTMLVLLVLFPIVMLEIKFLSPLLTTWNTSPATFIGNAISVSLVSWPLMPLTIHYLRWWLAPETQSDISTNVKGTLVVCALYLLEIITLWQLL